MGEEAVETVVEEGGGDERVDVADGEAEKMLVESSSNLCVVATGELTDAGHRRTRWSSGHRLR